MLLKIAYTVDNQTVNTASLLDTKTHVYEMKLSTFGFRDNLMVKVRLGILDEYVQHLFASCH